VCPSAWNLCYLFIISSLFTVIVNYNRMLTFDPWRWHDDFSLIIATCAFGEQVVLELPHVHVTLLLVDRDVATLVRLVFIGHEVVEADL
jgi:hypothetical protein